MALTLLRKIRLESILNVESLIFIPVPITPIRYGIVLTMLSCRRQVYLYYFYRPQNIASKLKSQQMEHMRKYFNKFRIIFQTIEFFGIPQSKSS